MEKLNLGQLGERLKTGGAQMGRMMSVKVREVKEKLLQAQTPESKMVEEATLETLEEANWGMNLRICAMINNDVFSGAEVLKSIKRRLSHRAPPVQTLALDLLEACAMNCDKVFSQIASEKLLDEMVTRVIDNPDAHPDNRRRAFHLIRSWGQSQDLVYLPVFHQTYMSLKERGEQLDLGGGSSPSAPYTLESYMHQQPLDPPENYPIPEAGLRAMDDSAFSYGHQPMSTEEKKELLVVARNSLELLSSILNSEAEPKPLKEDLTVSLLDKCKQSLSVIKGIVEGTTDDEVMLFEALNLNDELQQVVSKYEELEAAHSSGAQQQPENADAGAAWNPNELPGRFEVGDESDESEADENLERKLPQKSNTLEPNATDGEAHVETKTVDRPEEKNVESGYKRNAE